MRKIHILGMALFAVFALSAVFASMSSAAEWLVEELPITELLSVETVGEVTLEVLEEPILGQVIVLCSGILDGFISPLGLDEVTELLDLEENLINLTALVELGLACTNLLSCPTPLLWAEKLPWPTELLSTTDDVTLGSAYEIRCMGIIGEPSELCEAASVLTTLENMPLETPPDVLGTIVDEIGNLAHCENAGSEKGHVLSDEPALILALEGLGLSVS